MSECSVTDGCGFPRGRYFHSCFAGLVVCYLFIRTGYSHPGSGIVVDEQGNVYFIHTGRGCGRIDPQGKLTYVHESRGGHWMCLDAQGSFSRTQPKHFERITLSGVKPTLIYADGGSPIAVLRDGNLYYASNDEKMTPGGLLLTRQSHSGEISIFPPDGKKTTEKLGITGLASGPDGALYIASPSAVSKLKMDGTFTTLAHPIELKDCDVDYPDNDPKSPLPYLRGLAVDEHGTVFAAGAGCHAVVKISPDGKVETALKAERPWSPTGVAVHRGEVYVLEYTNANGSPREGWRPRVRRLGRDGKVTTLVTAELEPDKSKEADKTLSLPLGHNQQLELVWIAPGRFQMGPAATDKFAGTDSKPQREVQIEKGFYLGRTTVTFGQFQEFALDSGYRTDAETESRPNWRGGHGFNTERGTFEGLRPQYTWRNSGWPLTDTHPVGNVSWNDAIKFCEWMSKKSAKSVRLPTEAEWEYACRAGTTTVFFTGDDPASMNGYANLPDDSLLAKLGEPRGDATFPFDDKYAFTAPVGQFKPNPWGLHDMLGNVFQWCGDEIPGDTPKRVLRGGSYNLNIETCRCAYRGFATPGGRYSYTGFRVVVMP